MSERKGLTCHGRWWPEGVCGWCEPLDPDAGPPRPGESWAEAVARSMGRNNTLLKELRAKKAAASETCCGPAYWYQDTAASAPYCKKCGKPQVVAKAHTDEQVRHAAEALSPQSGPWLPWAAMFGQSHARHLAAEAEEKRLQAEECRKVQENAWRKAMDERVRELPDE